MSSSAEFTDAQIKECFDAIDADGTGNIDRGECNNFFKALGIEDSAECETLTCELLKDADSNNDGKISFAEFRKVLK